MLGEKSIKIYELFLNRVECYKYHRILAVCILFFRLVELKKQFMEPGSVRGGLHLLDWGVLKLNARIRFKHMSV